MTPAPTDRFIRYDELTALVHAWARERPDLVSVASIGRSHEGRELWLLSITNAKTGPADEKPADVQLHEQDERFNVGVGRTRDMQYLLVEIGSHTTNEYCFLRADNPTDQFQVIAPRVDEQEYYVDHRNGRFYIRTNDAGKNFRVVTAPVETPGREYWQELLPLDPAGPLEDFDLFAGFAVATRRKLGLPALEIYRFRDSGAATPALSDPVAITFPEPAYTAAQHVNRNFASQLYRYSYQSLVSPPSVYEYNVARQNDPGLPIGSSRLRAWPGMSA